MSIERNKPGFFEDLEIAGCICPPEDSVCPDGNMKYFRVVKSNPPSSECFLSYRKKYPNRNFQNECIARAVSLSDTFEGLLNSYYRTPAHKKKTRLIGILLLSSNDGMIKQTYAQGHYSWWRSVSFDPKSVKIQKVEK